MVLQHFLVAFQRKAVGPEEKAAFWISDPSEKDTQTTWIMGASMTAMMTSMIKMFTALKIRSLKLNLILVFLFIALPPYHRLLSLIFLLRKFAVIRRMKEKSEVRRPMAVVYSNFPPRIPSL